MALCQLSVTSDKSKNISTALNAIKDASASGAQIVVLPEMWNSPYSNDSFPVYAEMFPMDTSSAAAIHAATTCPSYAALSAAAAQHGIVVVGGSMSERTDDGSLYNTCCVFGQDGSRLGLHRKVHLFDIDIPGGITFKESDTLSPGMIPTVVDTPGLGVRIGIGICYDLRFPELAALYASRGAHLLVYPGAFNMTTGPVHWELLQRARAVDNQLFVAACSPARDEDAGYVAWGHSSIVGPFAEILAKAGSGFEIIYADLTLADIFVRRRNMPLQSQKRPDLYCLLDKTRE